MLRYWKRVDTPPPYPANGILMKKEKHGHNEEDLKVFYGLPQGGGAYFYPFLINREVWLDDEKTIPERGFYSTDAFNKYATEFIGKQKNFAKPFFLYLAHVAPHFPLQAKPEDIANIQPWPFEPISFEVNYDYRLITQNQSELGSKPE